MELEKQKTKDFIDAQKATKINNVAVTPEQAEAINEILKGRDFRKELIEKDRELLEKDKTSGMGSLPASLNHESSNDKPLEFEGATLEECHRNMIDYLHQKGDKATLRKLWEKSFSGMKQAPNSVLNNEYTAHVVTDEEGNVVDSPVKRCLANQRSDWRGNKKGVDA
jgi:hypothetical protein